MAPEVSTTSSYDEKVDVYSAALLVWYMITGQRPFEGIAGETVVVMVGRQRMRPQMDPKIFNKDLKALLSKAWAHEPEERPDSEDFLNSLNTLILKNTRFKCFLMS